MLPEARPLHIKQPKSSNTFFTFTNIDNLGAKIACTSKDSKNEEDYLMENIPEQRNKDRHEIGLVMLELFAGKNRRVYQSYEGLLLEENNDNFATCRVKVRQGEVLQPAKGYF